MIRNLSCLIVLVTLATCSVVCANDDLSRRLSYVEQFALDKSYLDAYQEVANVARNEGADLSGFVLHLKRLLVSKEVQESKQEILTEVVRFLIALTTRDIECNLARYKHFVRLVTVVFGSVNEFAQLVDSNLAPENDRQLFHFLDYYGRDKFDLCARSILVDEFDSNVHLDKEAEKFFDNWVSGGRLLDDDTLASEAKSIDLLTKEGIKFEQLQHAAEKSKKIGIDVKGDNPTVSVIESACSKSRLNLQAVFSIYNFAKIFDPTIPDFSTGKFRKWNEYRRICLQYQNPQTGPKVLKRLKSSSSGRIGSLFGAMKLIARR